MSAVPPDPRPISIAFPGHPLTFVRSWMRMIVHLNTRPQDEREEFLDPPAWLRTALLISFALDLFALATVVAAHDALVLFPLTAIYILTMLVPPVASPLGMIRTPRVAYLATLMLFWSPTQVLVTVAFGTLIAVVGFRLYEPLRALLNTVFWAYPAALASAIGHAVLRALPGHLIGLTAASLTILIVYLVTNFAMLALYRHLRRGAPFFAYWWSSLKENPLSQVLAVPVPILLGAVAYGTGESAVTRVVLTAISAVTMPAGRQQLANFLASQRTVQDIVRALMIALERVVPGAEAHAERVSSLVVEIGQRLRVPPGVLESWRTAALLHDIGLIDAGSRGSSPVTHAIVGARILDSYPDSAVAEMVREHHTPWSAVPPRLRSHVVLGARVLAAVEHYDELLYGTTTAPGFGTHSATVAALRGLAGQQLEPRIVDVLIEATERHEEKMVS